MTREGQKEQHEGSGHQRGTGCSTDLVTRVGCHKQVTFEQKLQNKTKNNAWYMFLNPWISSPNPRHHFHPIFWHYGPLGLLAYTEWTGFSAGWQVPQEGNLCLSCSPQCPQQLALCPANSRSSKTFMSKWTHTWINANLFIFKTPNNSPYIGIIKTWITDS